MTLRQTSFLPYWLSAVCWFNTEPAQSEKIWSKQWSSLLGLQSTPYLERDSDIVASDGPNCVFKGHVKSVDAVSETLSSEHVSCSHSRVSLLLSFI